LPKIRLAILSTHPIQYNAPAFAALAAQPNLEVKVFYEWGGTANGLDREFGRTVAWDVPLLDGYDYSFLRNNAKSPGTHHFFGINNPGVVDAISAWHPDVLFVYGWAFASHLRALRHFHGRIPILFRGDSTLLDERQHWRRIARGAALRMIYRNVDVALYPGEASRRYFLAHGLKPDQLAWAPHSVDNDRFSADSGRKEALARQWRDRLEIPADAVVFLFPGKLVKWKDPELLLDAFIGLRRSALLPAPHLIFAGDGDLLDLLRSRCDSRGDIHFIGFQNQSVMPIVYRLGDVTMLPSARDTWGLAVNESMATQRAAIVSDRVGCSLDLIRPLRTGIVFEAGNKASLEESMQFCLANRRHLWAMGQEARKLIDEWSIGEFVGATVEAVITLHLKRERAPQR